MTARPDGDAPAIEAVRALAEGNEAAASATLQALRRRHRPALEEGRARCRKCDRFAAEFFCAACGAGWCCRECACEDDALDWSTWERMSDGEGVAEIVCCRCSGAAECWRR